MDVEQREVGGRPPQESQSSEDAEKSEEKTKVVAFEVKKEATDGQDDDDVEISDEEEQDDDDDDDDDEESSDGKVDIQQQAINVYMVVEGEDFEDEHDEPTADKPSLRVRRAASRLACIVARPVRYPFEGAPGN